MSKGIESITLPDYAETTLRSIPEELKNKDTWICWTPSKKPINPCSKGLASKTDPDTWTDLQTAVEAVIDGKDGMYERKDGEFITEPVCGLGVAVTNEYVLIDIDGCIDDRGNLKKNVDPFISRFDSWTEISQSGNGLHILIEYGKEIPKNIDSSPDWLGCKKLEIYQNQFVFLTGDHYEGTPSTICPAREPLDALFDYLKENDQLSTSSDGETCSSSDVETSNDLDDEKVLERLKQESVEWRDVVENGYLSEKSENQPDVSRFDWNLLNKLWFYSGNDREQTIRLFRQILSKENRPRRNYKLYDDHYVNRTIDNISEENTGAYTREKEVDPEQQKIIDNLFELVLQDGISWPNNRTRRSRKSVYIALLKVAGRINQTTLPVSLRELSELAGYSTHTVSSSTKDLEQFGLIERDGKNNQGTFIYSLVPIEHIPDKLTQSINTLSCIRDCNTLSNVFSDYLDDAKFFPSELGKPSLAILSVLEEKPGLSMSETAEHIGSSPRTVRRKRDKLLDAGIIEVDQDGREKNLYLSDDWKEQLENYKPEDPSNLGRDIERKIEHIQDRIEYEKQKKEPDLVRLDELRDKQVKLLEEMEDIHQERQKLRENRRYQGEEQPPEGG